MSASHDIFSNCRNDLSDAGTRLIATIAVKTPEAAMEGLTLLGPRSGDEATNAIGRIARAVPETERHALTILNGRERNEAVISTVGRIGKEAAGKSNEAEIAILALRILALKNENTATLWIAAIGRTCKSASRHALFFLDEKPETTDILGKIGDIGREASTGTKMAIEILAERNTEASKREILRVITNAEPVEGLVALSYVPVAIESLNGDPLAKVFERAAARVLDPTVLTAEMAARGSERLMETLERVAGRFSEAATEPLQGAVAASSLLVAICKNAGVPEQRREMLTLSRH